MGGTIRMSSFKILSQVGPKDSGSQNFSFVALKAEPIGEVQILCTVTATAYYLIIIHKRF
jgi:hypothetical protein